LFDRDLLLSKSDFKGDLSEDWSVGNYN
jgi:hypothetical protein